MIALSIGLVYLWFGGLKFIPDMSPAQDLAIDTIRQLTFNLIPPKTSLFLLALWEVSVGVMLILNKFIRVVILIALLHMVCTFTPLLFFPDLAFARPPLGYTLLGQYIFKNIIIIAALVTLYKLSAKGVKPISLF
ncbi:MAG: doxx family protein [Verrucomicrobia bacterium]|nr:doxx family protein [Verrucomicrobiota bacterium]|tara:strand:- start:179 stop:583 length:405 start_codon:yes stop_codon:yes gene_type:complete